MTKTHTDFKVKEYKFVTKFKCLANKCADSCCKILDMQVDNNSKTFYESFHPEINDSIHTKDNELYFKKDCQTSHCVNLSNGKCKIQQSYSPEILSDDCYFYPKIINRLQDQFIVSASLSCPEITRMAIFEENNFDSKFKFYDRIPVKLNHSPRSNNFSNIYKLHELFIDFLKYDSSNNFLIKLINIGNSLININKNRWYNNTLALNQIGFKSNHNQEIDNKNFQSLIKFFVHIIHHSQLPVSENLLQIFSMIEQAFKCLIDLQNNNVSFTDDSSFSTNQLSLEQHNLIEKILKNWLHIQLINTLFPISLNNDNIERTINYLVIRFLINKILLCLNFITLPPNSPDEVNQKRLISIIYINARYLDNFDNIDILNQSFQNFSWHENSLIEMVKNL